MPPFQMTGLDHVVLRIGDLPRMLGFYQGVLGCTVDKVQAEIGLTQLRAGRALIDLVTLDGVLGKMGGAGPGEEGRNMDHFAIAIGSFDEPAIRAYLGEHDIEIVGAGQRYGAEGDGPSIYVKDPEGNIVELKGPPN